MLSIRSDRSDRVGGDGTQTLGGILCVFIQETFTQAQRQPYFRLINLLRCAVWRSAFRAEGICYFKDDSGRHESI